MKHQLYIVTGTSGAGKTTVIPELRKGLDHVVVYDGDSVVVESDYNISKCNWLRIAKGNADSGINTVICSTIIPENLFDCDHVKYFDIYYINLRIDDETIIKRLQHRNWNEELIKNYVNFSKWLIEHKDKAFDPPMLEIYAEGKTPKEIANQIIDYINSH